MVVTVHVGRSEEVKQKRWFAAVTRGDEAEVAKLLVANPTLIDAKNLARHPSALHIAAFHGFDKIVALLLQTAAKKPASSSSSFLIDDQTGWTVLHVAAGQGRNKVVEHLLLAAKGSPSSTSSSSTSSSSSSSASSSSSSSSSSFSSMVDATDLDGCTALHHAARSGSCRVVELLLAVSPTLLDVVDKDGCTALLYAVKRRHEAMVDHLLALNPKNLDAVDADACGVVASGMNVLHHAISQGNETLVLRLLEMRPDLIYKPSRSGFTPLSMAMDFPFVMKLFALYSPQAVAALTDIDKARLLWEAVQGAMFKENDENEEGCGEIGLDLLLPISTLDELKAAFEAFEALKNKKLRCAGQLRAFVEAQCDILAMVFLNQDVMGIVNEYLFGGARSEAAESEAAEESEVSSDARERRRREEQWFEAAVEDDEKLMAQLLEEDPTLIDSVSITAMGGFLRGGTALHIASYEGCARVVALLLAVKPSLTAERDHRGNTALYLTRGKDKIVEILLAASPSSGLIANFEGTTALMQAARYGSLEKVRLLLAGCPEALDMVDQYQRTALLYAAQKEHLEIVSLLLAAKPRNVRAAGYAGWNVLHFEVSLMESLHVEKNVEKILAIDPGLVRTLTVELQTPLWLAVDKRCDNDLIEDLFHRFPHAVHMADASGRTPHDIAVQRNNDFLVNLFS